MFARKKKVVIEVNEAEYHLICEGLLLWRNKLASESHYTTPIDELLIKLME